MTFFGEFRGDHHTWEHLKESPFVVWFPLVVLSVPSVVIGWILYEPMVLQHPGLLGNSVATGLIFKHPDNAIDAMLEGMMELPFMMTVLGTFAAWICYIKMPELPAQLVSHTQGLYKLLINKFGFDKFNDWFWVKGSKNLGNIFFNIFDQKVIDGFGVNGVAGLVGRAAAVARQLQTGYLYHYLTAMVLGLMFIVFWFLLI
jgi:NADH-quinone oxidoreductase subunit L